MNWIRKPTAFEHQQRLNNWQKNRAKTYLRESESLASAFLAAQNTKSVAQTEQVVKSAVERLQAEAKNKLESKANEFDAVLGKLSKLA